MAQNLLASRSTYNRYFGDFRGVDFSSDHTQVHEQRLAYAVNMYKDYNSGQGKALETIPGYRRRMRAPNGQKIYAIHEYSYLTASGETKKDVLVHAGTALYRYTHFPYDSDVTESLFLAVPVAAKFLANIPVYKLKLPHEIARIESVYSPTAGDLTANTTLTAPDEIEISASTLADGDTVTLYCVRYVTESAPIFDGMAENESTSFIMNNLLYLIDGKNYIVYDGSTCRNATASAYIPTTYINIVPGGENADAGEEYEQRNILSPYFTHTFIGDSTTKEYYMNENELEAVVQITVNGEELGAGGATIDLAAGKITFKEAPSKPANEGSANVEIVAQKTLTKIDGVTDHAAMSQLITQCTRAAVFDGRVFMTGNPDYPNHVFYCGRNSTGYADPTYFGILDYMQDGVGNAQNTAILAVADTLMVLKEDTQQDGSVYFHTPLETTNGVQPKIYPSTRGLAGIGCLGAAINFLDDPVFVSRLGLEAVGQLSVRYERAIEHRSSLIDAKLSTLDLSHAVLEEWNGYLVMLIDGMAFLADSRQKYTHDIGVMQYEWYYLEDLGNYEGQYTEYRYSAEMPAWVEGKSVRYCTKCARGAKNCTCASEDGWIEIPLTTAEAVYDADTDETLNLCGTQANPPDADGNETGTVLSEVYEDEGVAAPTEIYYTVASIRDSVTLTHDHYEAYLCETKGAKTGGRYYPASTVKTIDGVLYFGTENGHLCAFNTDKRVDDGTIPKQYYTFNERTIYTGCATKMDNCGIPHLTKSTVKKSTVVKTKSFASSTAKIKVRTNRKMYEQIARINSSVFSFDDVDFSEFSFETADQSLFSIREKEKKWVEKQYFVYSDEYMRPFALYYICYRYVIAGRFKE